MPSSASPNLRLDFQATGENVNTWGNKLNTNALQLLEDAISSRAAFTLSGPKTLTAANFATDEARCAVLDITGGTGGTITIPGVEKLYLVRNAAAGDVILTTGSGTTATFKPGDVGNCFCDNTNVRQAVVRDFQGAKITGVGAPTADTDAATRKFVLDTAFASSSGTFPGQPGNQNRFLGTDGAAAGWADPLPLQTSKAGQLLGTNGTDRTGGLWRWAGLNGRASKSGSYTVVASDNEKLISTNSAVGFTASATLGSQFGVYIAAAGAVITLTPNGAETIDGAATVVMLPGESRLIVCDGANLFTALRTSAGNGAPDVIVQDQKANATAAVPAIATTWTSRALNTVVRNIAGATLSTDQVTLPAGTWLIRGRAPFYNGVGLMTTRLLNVTDAASLAIGSAATTVTTNGGFSVSEVVAVATFTSAKAIALQYYADSTIPSLSRPLGFGFADTFSCFEATKLA